MKPGSHKQYQGIPLRQLIMCSYFVGSFYNLFCVTEIVKMKAFIFVLLLHG
jgi:hypothetical protein